MMRESAVPKKIVQMIAGIWISVFGPVTLFHQILLIMIVFDYMTGLINAMVHRKLNSTIGYRGIGKKIYMLLLTAVAEMLDRAFLHTGILGNVVCTFYIFNEALSIIENAGCVGMPLPSALRATIEKLKIDHVKHTEEQENE